MADCRQKCLICSLLQNFELTVHSVIIEIVAWLILSWICLVGLLYKTYFVLNLKISAVENWVNPAVRFYLSTDNWLRIGDWTLWDGTICRLIAIAIHNLSSRNFTRTRQQQYIKIAWQWKKWWFALTKPAYNNCYQNYELR